MLLEVWKAMLAAREYVEDGGYSRRDSSRLLELELRSGARVLQ